jgi:hypothetical protein
MEEVHCLLEQVAISPNNGLQDASVRFHSALYPLSQTNLNQDIEPGRLIDLERDSAGRSLLPGEMKRNRRSGMPAIEETTGENHTTATM